MAELFLGWRARFARWLHTSADLILLHLCFLVASVPVVTVVPAAISLQRSMADMLLRGETAIVATFWPHYRHAVRRFTGVGVVVLAYAVLVVASVYLWAGFDGTPQTVGLASVLALGALCVGLYLAGLAWAGSTGAEVREGFEPEETWRSLWHGARNRFAAQPMPVLACVLVTFGWLLLMSQVPPLGLFGFGLVPALLAHWLNRVSAVHQPTS